MIAGTARRPARRPRLRAALKRVGCSLRTVPMGADVRVHFPVADSCARVEPMKSRCRDAMLIRLGYELAYEFPQATPMILNLNVHYSRISDWVRADAIVTEPKVPLRMYRDAFGNWCTRLIAPAGAFRVTSDAIIRDSGL